MRPVRTVVERDRGHGNIFRRTFRGHATGGGGVCAHELPEGGFGRTKLHSCIALNVQLCSSSTADVVGIVRRLS